MEKFFENLLKIIGAITFAKPIMNAISAVVRTFSLIVQINVHGIEKLAQESRNQIRNHRGTLLITVIVITGAIILFFSLGATFHSKILISIGGFWMITPLIVLATMGEAVAKLITLYLQTVEGTLKGFHAALLGVLKKMGVEAENSLPKPELLDENKFAKKIHSVWTAIIPLSLATIFCIFFPAWSSVGVIPIMLFILISQAIMADQWGDIDLEADDKKLINTARTKRRVFRLISFGLTILMFWTAYSVTFQSSAKKTEKDITKYVDKASLLELPVNLVKDGYNAIAEPVKKWQAEKNSAEAVKKIAQARADSLAAIPKYETEIVMSEVGAKWYPSGYKRTDVYLMVVPPNTFVHFKDQKGFNAKFDNSGNDMEKTYKWAPYTPVLKLVKITKGKKIKILKEVKK